MTPEQQAEQDKLPSLQYKLICKAEFDRNTAEHKAIVEKLDLIIERQSQIKADLAATQETANEVYRSVVMGNGDSIVTQVRMQKGAIETLQKSAAKANNRLWDFVKLLLAAALPLIFLWLTHNL